MILPFEHDAQFKATNPSFGRECAGVLFQRGMIAEHDMTQVSAVIARSAAPTELATSELAQRHLITQQNKAVVTEFINRVARRMQLKAKGLKGCETGTRRARAYRVLKSTRLLTADRLTTLVTRLVASTEAPAA